MKRGPPRNESERSERVPQATCRRARRCYKGEVTSSRLSCSDGAVRRGRRVQIIVPAELAVHKVWIAVTSRSERASIHHSSGLACLRERDWNDGTYSFQKGSNPGADSGHEFACSQRDARFKSRSSRKRGPVNWSPNGTPFGSMPAGTDMAG